MLNLHIADLLSKGDMNSMMTIHRFVALEN